MPQAPRSYSIPSKILLPLDFSSSSDLALGMATDLAEHFAAALHLLHIVPMLPMVNAMDSFPESPLPYDVTFLRESQGRAEHKLASLVGELLARKVKASSSVEIGNDVAGNIMTVIEGMAIDLVILSTHGISGWRPLVFGSIAEQLVKQVKCPLLLLRSVETNTHAGIAQVH